MVELDYTSSEKTLIITIVGDQMGSDTICTAIYSRISILYTDYICSDSRRLAPDSDFVRITTEHFDILLHPAHGCTLITQC
jgi:hypothetical protein